MKQRLWTCTAAAAGMLLLILDTKTALLGAKEAFSLCMHTVVPALLPFVFLSSLLTSALTGAQSPLLRPIGMLLRIPKGSESLFIIGALGGYPTGAQAISAAYSAGQLHKRDAQRMVGFCSNAGPSFLFGITAAAFSNPSAPWMLWLIHLTAAVIAAVLLPGGCKAAASIRPVRPITAFASLQRSIKVIAQICGWILLFRVLLAFLDRWFLWLVEPDCQVVFRGLLELTIGCTSLDSIANTGLRFTVCAAILGFGGLCVVMQTASCTAELGMGMYIPAKVLQCIISAMLAALYQSLFYSQTQRYPVPIWFYLVGVGLLIIIILLLQKSKKRCSISQPVVV